jgi:hypothetical protein
MCGALQVRPLFPNLKQDQDFNEKKNQEHLMHSALIIHWIASFLAEPRQVL